MGFDPSIKNIGWGIVAKNELDKQILYQPKDCSLIYQGVGDERCWNCQLGQNDISPLLAGTSCPYYNTRHPKDERLPIILDYGLIKIPVGTEQERIVNIRTEVSSIILKNPNVTEFIVEKPGRFARGRFGKYILSVQLLQSAFTLIVEQCYQTNKRCIEYMIKPRLRLAPMRKRRIQTYLKQEYDISGQGRAEFLDPNVADALGLALWQYSKS